MKKKISLFIQENIPDFHRRRLDSLARLQFDKVLKSKNPYLFKAKNINTAGELVKALLDAHLSSQEETIFGSFLEGVAIYTCSLARGGWKSGITGIDLEFDSEGARYIVSIKSGPKWANRSQLDKMKDNFKKATTVLRQNGTVKNVVAVNGCCYGRDNKPDKGTYLKYCGERFWTFISNDPQMYLDLIQPLGHMAKERNEEFLAEYAKVTNLFSKLFLENYCALDMSIDWDQVVKLNSAADAPRKARASLHKVKKS